MRLGDMMPGHGYFDWRPVTTDDLKRNRSEVMSDEKDDDNTNEKAIRKVVKKSVSDLFGEPEKPEPADRPWVGTDAPYGSGRQSSFLWEREDMWPDKRLPHLKATRWDGASDPHTAAAWGQPQSSRKTLVRPEYDDKGHVSTVHFTDEAWKKLRRRVWKDLCEGLDFERVILTEEDNVRLEQMLDTVMRRAKFQVGQAGNYFRKGSLAQVPISIGDQPPADPQALPASVVEEDEGWDDTKKEEGNDETE